MSENSHETFEFLMTPGSVAQGGSEVPLVSRDCAFDLPTLAIDAFVEAALHLAPVLRPRPLSSVAFPSGDNGRSNSEFLSAQDMVVLSVVSRVAQDPIKGHQGGRFLHGRSELGRVWGRTHADVCSRQEMGFPIADEGQLGPPKPDVTFLSLSPHVVTADVVGLQARSVHDAFRSLGDEIQLATDSEDLALKNSEALFFKRRSSA